MSQINAIRNAVQPMVLAALTALLLASTAAAHQNYIPVTSPIDPLPIDRVPPVERVPGKEFTDAPDTTYAPVPHTTLPSQLGRFDGLGGTENSLYLGAYGPTLADFNVDAQSQVRDALFEAVRDNRVPLVVSTSFDQMLGADVALAAERTGGAVQSFATSDQIVDHAHMGGQLRNIDSVDLWGPEAQSRAAFYSFGGDPGDVSIYTLQGLAPSFLAPYVTTAEIGGAIGNTALAPLIDVDGLMVNDVGTGFNPFDGEFGPGDSMIFSIAPIPNPEGGPDFFDGGEIWLWEFGQPAEFLDHGGHLWDTAFDVRGTFGTQSENVDAIEAVSIPEPSSIAFVIAAIYGLVGLRRRKTSDTV